MKTTKATRAPWAAALAIGALALAPVALWAQAPGADPEAPPTPPPGAVAPQVAPAPALPERISDSAPAAPLSLPAPAATPGAARGKRPAAGAKAAPQADPGFAAILQGLLSKTNVPKFEYQAAGRRDPMLVPWSRLRVEANRCYAQAEAAFAAGNLDEAQKQYENVLRLDQQMRAEGYALAAMDELVVETQAAYRTVLDEKLKQREAPGGAQGDKVMAALPEEIRNATESGIIYNPADKTCMVGGVLLKEGQKYPGYENVLVQRIEKDKIVYKVGDKEFETPVKDPSQEGEQPKP